MPTPLIILIILAIITFAIISWQQDKKRREALRAWAFLHKLTFDGEKSKDWDHKYSGLKLFGKGHGKFGKNVMTGTFRSNLVTLLDYQYTTGSGKNRTTHRRGVVLLKCDFPTIPLLIRRENPLDRVGEFFGADDIDFESAEFSRKFFVKSPDKRWAYDIIHTRTMEYLLGVSSVTIEFGYGEIAVYQNGFCNPEKYQQALDVAVKMYKLIPEFVVKAQKGEQR